jgi:ketosteroid isomerase-like protein
MSQADVELLKRIYAHWGRGDYSTAESLHPEFQLIFSPGFLDEGTFTGVDEAWRGWREWLQQWETWTYDVTRYVELDDGRIAAFLEITGIGKSTGLELTFAGGNVWELEGGQARSCQLYVRAEDMVRELGLDGA